MDTILFSKTAKLAGTSIGSLWSWVFEQEAEDENIREARGQLYAVLEIGASDDFSAASAGREAWEKLTKAYFSNDAGGPLEALEKAVAEAQTEIEGQMREFGKYNKDSWQFSICGAVLWGKVLYLAVLGAAKVQLLRNSTLQTIVTSKVKKISEESRIQLASGYVENDDMIILGSEGFWQTINLDQMPNVTNLKEVNEIVEALAPTVHSLVDSSTVAALFIKLATVEAPNIEEEGIVFVENNNGKQELVVNEPANNLQGDKFTKIKQNIKAVLAKINLKFLTKTPGLYLKEDRSDKKKRQKAILFIIAVLLAVLVGSVFWGLSQRSQSSKKVKFTNLYEQASEQYDQGQGLIGLNPAKAREHFQEGVRVLAQAKLVGVEKDKVGDLETKLNEGLSQSLQVINVEDPTVFLDLGLVKSGAIGAKIAGFDKTLIIWDQAGKSVLRVNTQNKSAEVVAGGNELSQGSLIAASNDFVYVYVANDGIWRINLADKSKKRIIEKDDAWGEIVDIYSFAGNVYLLDKINNQVHKYSSARDGYGPRTGFVESDASASFTNATSMTIDGLIWVLSANGKLDKLIGGRVENLQVGGIDRQITNGISVDGDDRAKYLYILDKAEKRVVVATKDGQYWSQYTSDIFANAHDLIVDEPAKKLFVLAANKVYIIDLK